MHVQRFLFFTYGVAAYLVFLATFLYAIAFVGGFAVPAAWTVRGRRLWPAAVAIDGLLLTIFAVQHSIMARRWFKERWTQIVPWAIERSTYVLCASLALLLLFWQWRPIGVQIWSIEHPAARVVGLDAVCRRLGDGADRDVPHQPFRLVRLAAGWLPLIGRPYQKVEFRTPMPYRYVRHPLYLGFLLAFWMTPTMTLAHLFFALATTAYIVLAIQFEENDLLHEHGASYQEYRRGRCRCCCPTGRGARRGGPDRGKRARPRRQACSCPQQLADPLVAEEQHSHATDASPLVTVVRGVDRALQGRRGRRSRRLRTSFRLRLGSRLGSDGPALRALPESAGRRAGRNATRDRHLRAAAERPGCS